MGRYTGIKGLCKVPDTVIIKSQADEIKSLKQKVHQVVQKAKEREEHWKAYTDELLNTIRLLQENNADEEQKAVNREARALKRKDQHYQQLLEENRKLKLKVEALKEQKKELSNELEGRTVEDVLMPRNEIRKQFGRLTNRRQIMEDMGFAYNGNMPLAYNAVLFLEWVRNNRLWGQLYSKMEESKRK